MSISERLHDLIREAQYLHRCIAKVEDEQRDTLLPLLSAQEQEIIEQIKGEA